jgi:peptidyl-prolyl cis-trans isomerase D
MLGKMRANKKNKTVIWIILGLLAIGLVGFGGAGVGGGTIRSVGQVGDEKINVNVYAQAMNQALSNLSQQFGRTVTNAEAQAFGVQSSVLQNLLSTAALDNEAKQIGISIGDEAVRAQLMANNAFLSSDGTFNKQSYEFTLERSGLSPSEFEDMLRKEAARGFLQSAVIGGLASQGTQTRALLLFDRESRDFSWAELPKDALDAPVADPTDAQIQAYYEANPDAYTAPLTREITYAWLNPEMLSSRVDIDEAQIKASYDLQSDRFIKPEKRSLERLVFATMAEATDARNAIDAGSATFDSLLADRGLSAAAIDLGEVLRGGISTAAADLVFGDTGTGIVGPVDSKLGPALFRINAILAEQITPFEDARAEITAELEGEAARRLVFDMVPDIDDLLAAGDTLETLAKDTDMELGTISLTADTSEGIAAYENFRTVANQTQKGDFPEINDLADGGIFALRVDEVKKPALRPLAEVKDQVITDWKQAETVRLLTLKADALKETLNAGGDFGDLVAQTETGKRRADFIENTPPQLLGEMFNLDPGQASVIAGTDSVFVARLDKINAFDPDAEENQLLVKAIQQQIDAQIGTDLLGVFAEALREEAGVSINQPAINQINTQLTGG